MTPFDRGVKWGCKNLQILTSICYILDRVQNSDMATTCIICILVRYHAALMVDNSMRYINLLIYLLTYLLMNNVFVVQMCV